MVESEKKFKEILFGLLKVEVADLGCFLKKATSVL
jgi:hypothetical protein